jgi:hypothetical protein
MPHPTRRVLFLGVAAATLTQGCALAQTREITIYKTPYCDCCGGWVDHLKRAGFNTSVVMMEDLTPIRTRFNIPFELTSCHTGVIAGYAVEGHVPAQDVERLLKERPEAIGILVPGMPIGSPGMEIAGAPNEAFETLLLEKSGKTRVFARHAAKA